MNTISLKISEAIFNETEKIRALVHISRNKYINEAIEAYNKTQRRQILEQMLKKESELVQTNSMDILAEFEKIDPYTL